MTFTAIERRVHVLFLDTHLSTQELLLVQLFWSALENTSQRSLSRSPTGEN